jgi:GNAT superfamily N-acetyltransferase
VSHSTTMEYLIRQAEVADAPGACEAVRQSIAELCIEDHHGDQATIAAWLSNKTIENVASWIGSPRNITAVAQASIGIVGFGLLSQSGTLALLYVSPLARFHGVSKGLMAFLENEASRLGIREIRLESSATARQFYEGRGFSPVGESSLAFGTVISYPMWKGLAP